MKIRFIGYEEKCKHPFPLFNVDEPGHPLHRSTVSEGTVKRYSLGGIPEHPTYEGWQYIQRAAMDLYTACKAVLPQHLGKEHGEMLARAIDRAEGRAL
jgi:hypothetical protein